MGQVEHDISGLRIQGEGHGGGAPSPLPPGSQGAAGAGLWMEDFKRGSKAGSRKRAMGLDPEDAPTLASATARVRFF